MTRFAALALALVAALLPVAGCSNQGEELYTPTAQLIAKQLGFYYPSQLAGKSR